MAAVVVGKGGGGKHPPPPAAIYIKANSLSRETAMTVAEFVCMVSIIILDSIATICNSNNYSILQWNVY